MDLDKVVDVVIDICSSGQNGELEEWHEKELKELFKKVKKEEKEELFEMIVEYMKGSEGWYVNDMKLIKELLGVKKKVKIEI